jgi:NOL1/NOP2/fmu family ribosome biogenesis protein
MKIDVLSRAKKKRFLAAVEGFGISKVDEVLIRTGKERIRAFSGDLDKTEILALWRVLPVEVIGLYVGKDFVSRHGKRETRLSLDGIHAWKSQVESAISGRLVVRGSGGSARVVQLSEEQEEKWFLGENIELSSEQGKIGEGFVAVKSGEDFVGTGKVDAEGKILYSFLPKERRRKPKMS